MAEGHPAAGGSKVVKLFLRLALSGAGRHRPRVINVDGHPALWPRHFRVEANRESGRALTISAIILFEQHH
jgi:hypothetical protein